MKKFILTICLISVVIFVAVAFPEQKFTLSVLCALAAALMAAYLLAKFFIRKLFSSLDNGEQDI